MRLPRWLRRPRRTVTETRLDERSPHWARYHVIMTVAGHRPSGLADAFGGYLCHCQTASWSHSDSYGPYGGCPQGWYDAREFLARHGVPDEVNLVAELSPEDEEWVDGQVHEFKLRNGLCAHDDPLCRKYGCPDDPDWTGDR